MLIGYGYVYETSLFFLPSFPSLNPILSHRHSLHATLLVNKKNTPTHLLLLPYYCMNQQQQPNKSRRHPVQMYVPVHKRAEPSSDPNSPTTNRDDPSSPQLPEVSKSAVRKGRGKFQAPAEASVDEDGDAPTHSPKGREFDATQLRTYAPDETKRASRASKHKSMPVSDHSIATRPNEDRRRSRVLHDDHRASVNDVNKLSESMAGLATGPYEGSDDGQREEWEDLLKDYDHYDSNENDSPRLNNRKKRLSSHIDLFSAPSGKSIEKRHSYI